MFMLALHKMCNSRTKMPEDRPAGMPPPLGPRKTPETKKEKVKKQYDQVKKLRNDGLSWERIARILAKDHRIKIGPI